MELTGSPKTIIENQARARHLGFVGLVVAIETSRLSARSLPDETG
jgi:hypothetical protein